MFRSGAKEELRSGRIAELRDAGAVPRGALALPLRGAQAVLRAGESISGPAIIVPAESLEVSMVLPDLADRDGILATLEVVLVIDPPKGATGLRLLTESLGSRTSYDVADLAQDLARIWADALLPRAARILWADSGDLVARLDLAADIPEPVLASLFDRGLRLERVRLASAASDQLAAAQEARRRRREEAARIRERLEFLELWRREEQGEVLAREEVERLAAHMRQEGLLRRIEHDREEHLERLRSHEELSLARERVHRRLERERLISKVEIDEVRLAQELAQSERLQEAFERNGWLPLVRAVADREGQVRLLERLIEKEMTPEQLAARGAADARIEQLEARIEALRQHIERRGLPSPLAAAIGALPPVRRIWLAAGLALHRIDGDPVGAERDARPVLPPEEIGFLRSVQVLRDGAMVCIAVGGQGGVGLYRPESSEWEIYRFRAGEEGRGGANAVALAGEIVLASHSRLGLTAWDRGDARSLRRPYADRLVPGRSTRAIQEDESGGWIFGHGAEVYRAPPGLQPEGLRTLGVLPDSVTALCRSGGATWAGTQSGRLYRLDGEARWTELPFATTGPVYQILSPTAAGERIWVVGARQAAAHVLDDRGGRLADYRSRYPIRWVGAGAAGPFAVDRFGQHLIAWSWDQPESPVRRIRVPDQIHSIAVEEAR